MAGSSEFKCSRAICLPGAAVKSLYVGPITDPSITERVNRFAQIKSDFKGRRELVRSMVAAGLPVPDLLSGAVIEAMGRAGFFRLRGVLALAYQAYAGILGVRLGARQLMTQDADFAQFGGASENVSDAMKPPVESFKGLDESFRAMPHLGDPIVSTQYRNSAAYRVDFLTPDRGSDDHRGKPAKMKALSGAGAEPQRHLDFLIHQPERSVLLQGGGVPVVVPRAERKANAHLFAPWSLPSSVTSLNSSLAPSTKWLSLRSVSGVRSAQSFTLSVC